MCVYSTAWIFCFTLQKLNANAVLGILFIAVSVDLVKVIVACVKMSHRHPLQEFTVKTYPSTLFPDPGNNVFLNVGHSPAYDGSDDVTNLVCNSLGVHE